MKQEKKSTKRTASEKVKKKIKRSNIKHAGFNKNVSKRSRWHLMDWDYLDKLTPEEKEWLHNFTEEEVHANFAHKGEKLNKKAEEKRKVYGSNNSRNRDMYTLAKAAGTLDHDIGGEKEDITNGLSTEDTIIALLDAKDSLMEKLTNVDDSESEGSKKRNKSK
jgi:hypothetical protein